MMNIEYKRPSPSVTMVLVCYNQENYIKEAIFSALNQNYSPLKIIISDDCSKDGTVSIIEGILQEYHGPHEVFFKKNTVNQGLIKHINLVNNLVDTELLVIAAGDDISHPNRVTEIIDAYRLAEQQPTSIYSSVNKITPDGKLLDIFIPPIEQLGHSVLDCALSESLIIGASHAWHKSLFTTFGDIKELGAYEDLVLAYRSAILNGLLYIDKPLVDYRIDIGISNVTQDPDLSNAQKLENLLKIMKPVLLQRLLDSSFIADNKLQEMAIQKIKVQLSKIDLEYAFIKGEKVHYLLYKAIKTSNLPLFLKYLIKRLRGCTR
ncbi:glycosyltransferase [Acinetobacter sp. ANC 3791]|uniref:glycosyltransferase n=1 Tax=Acinetobacter sp. ANC 3791 TaxID=2529836 RepID=UPI00103EC723|nr:glycosyltransferase [Acinetobacter sp. ANC 3791]TCB82744.1 glycosyltransferase [Acinetobacter sp. ANC 3791]